MIIKNNRIIIYKNEIDPSINLKGVKGGRYFKREEKWSFPIEEMNRFLKKPALFEIEQEWFEIFPDFKFLSGM